MASSSSESAKLSVLSWNINGLKAKLQGKGLNTKNQRKTALLKIINKYDIVLLQETKIGQMKDPKDHNKNWEIITEALSNKYILVILEGPTRRETVDDEEEEGEGEEVEEEEEGGEEEEEGEKKTMYLTYFSSNSKGVAIIVNKKHTVVKSFSEDGYYAGVHVEIDGLEYTFVSVYYHSDADDQIRNLMEHLQGSDDFKCRLVIGGDFNTTLDPELDANPANPQHDARRKILREFLNTLNLSDIWRKEHPEERKYTRRHHTGTGNRLDYIFMLKKEEVENYVDSDILNKTDLSDHSPVSLTLNYTAIQQRREE